MFPVLLVYKQENLQHKRESTDEKKHQEDKNLCLNNLTVEYINSLYELNIHEETIFKGS